MKIPALVAISLLTASAASAQVGVGSAINGATDTGINSATGTGIDSATGTAVNSTTNMDSDVGAATKDTVKGGNVDAATKDTVKGGADVDTGTTGNASVGADVNANTNANVGVDTGAKTDLRTHDSSFTAATIDPSLVGRSVYSQSGKLIGTVDWASDTGAGASVALDNSVAAGKPKVMMSHSQLATDAKGNLVANMSDTELDTFIHSHVQETESSKLKND